MRVATRFDVDGHAASIVLFQIAVSLVLLRNISYAFVVSLVYLRTTNLAK